jgi:hypothetical protein
VIAQTYTLFRTCTGSDSARLNMHFLPAKLYLVVAVDGSCSFLQNEYGWRHLHSLTHSLAQATRAPNHIYKVRTPPLSDWLTRPLIRSLMPTQCHSLIQPLSHPSTDSPQSAFHYTRPPPHLVTKSLTHSLDSLNTHVL